MAGLGRGERNCAVISDAGAIVRFVRETVAREHLQELGFEAVFDAAICVDGMEYVPPGDWPLVLGNLRRAVRPGSLIYLTVEQIDRAEVARAYMEAVAAGLPVVMGEHHRRGGGYHHYPTRDQVEAWLTAEQLEVVAEGHSRGSNYSYLHLLVRARTPGAHPFRTQKRQCRW